MLTLCAFKYEKNTPTPRRVLNITQRADDIRLVGTCDQTCQQLGTSIANTFCEIFARVHSPYKVV